MFAAFIAVFHFYDRNSSSCNIKKLWHKYKRHTDLYFNWYYVLFMVMMLHLASEGGCYVCIMKTEKQWVGKKSGVGNLFVGRIGQST